MSDLYDDLGVESNATETDLKKAYRNAAKRTHPDKGGDPTEFAKVTRAALILLDPKKRQKYDDEGLLLDNVDNTDATAIERVAQFFINSIEASMHNPVTLDDLDLIKGGIAHFQSQIMQLEQANAENRRRIHQFEEALQRLKTKRKNDVISRMIKHHIGQFGAVMEANKNNIRICERAIDVLKDYTFEQRAYPDQTGTNPYSNNTGIFSSFTRPRW